MLSFWCQFYKVRVIFFHLLHQRKLSFFLVKIWAVLNLISEHENQHERTGVYDHTTLSLWLDLLICDRAGAIVPLNFFCIRCLSGQIKVTQDFAFKDGDEFDLKICVTLTAISGEKLTTRQISNLFQTMSAKIFEWFITKPYDFVPESHQPMARRPARVRSV